MPKLSSLISGRQGLRAATVLQLVSKYMSVLVNLLVTMILARMLTPEQYGVVAVVSVFSALFSVLSNVGINAAVIQYRQLTPDDCDALFSFTVVVGVAMMAVFCLLSYPVSLLYGDSGYVSLMCVASPGVLLNAANMVPSGVLVRERRFFAIGFRTVVVSLAAGAIAVCLALRGFGAYSLIAESVFSSAAVLAWNLSTSKVKAGNWRFGEPLRLVGRFSGYQFVSQIMAYLVRNFDTVVIGAAFGATALGYYDKGYKLAKYPIDYIPLTLSPVLKSFFSSMEGDLSRLYDLYFKIEKALSILGVFFAVFFFFAAEELVLLLFGDQWGQSILILRILSVSLFSQLVNFPTFSILEGVKRADLEMRHMLVTGAASVLLVLAGIAVGDLHAVSVAVSASFILTTFSALYFVIHKVFKKSVPRFARRFVPELIAGLALAVAYFLAEPLMPDGLLPSLLVKLLLGVVVYGGLLWPLGQLPYIASIFRKSGKPAEERSIE